MKCQNLKWLRGCYIKPLGVALSQRVGVTILRTKVRIPTMVTRNDLFPSAEVLIVVLVEVIMHSIDVKVHQTSML